MNSKCTSLKDQARLKVDWALCSVAGPGSQQNEDYVLADPAIGVFVIADGMGGRPNGAQASKLATEAFVSRLRAPATGKRLDEGVLRDAVQTANDVIRQTASTNEMLEGMGTTLSALVLDAGKAKAVHVGDSRIYVCREGRMVQLTKDHTLMEELVARNHLTRADTTIHPLRHVLARSVGGQETADADIIDVEAQPGDCFLLTSDGLTGSLSQSELEEIFLTGSGMSARKLCRILRDRALKSSVQDDTSALVLKISLRHSLRDRCHGLTRQTSACVSGHVEVKANQHSTSAWGGISPTNRTESMARDWESHLRQISECKAALSDQQKKERDTLSKQYLSLLEIVDAFERVFENVETKKDLCTPQMKIWIGNFRTAYKLLGRFLKEQGVVPIENLDQGFDPRWHEVSEKIFDPACPEGTVVREMKRGYLWHGILLRRSGVVVTTSEETQLAEDTKE